MNGCDIEKDSVVLKSGEHIGPAEMGLLATAGVTAVKVHHRPTIAVFSTGDELVQPSTAALGRGQIRDSNRAKLLAAAIQQQCKVVDLGIAKDTGYSLKEHMDAALRSDADIVLTSGGLYMGDRDLVKPCLILMKPGKPLTFVKIITKDTSKPSKTILAFGLPGNPVSCMVCFNLFVVPIVRLLSGWSNPHLQRVHVRLSHPLRADPHHPDNHHAVIRWVLDDGFGRPGYVAESTGQQASSRLLSMKSANALLEVPSSGQILAAGTCLQALLISDMLSSPWDKLPASSKPLPPHFGTSAKSISTEDIPCIADSQNAQVFFLK